MNDSLIYVFCFTDSPLPAEMNSLSENLSCLSVDKLFAVGKTVSSSEYSQANLKKGFSDLPWVEAQTREHVQVISRVMKHCTVLPCKFATVFASKENLENFVREHARSLKENFRHVANKEEWSVKIYCDRVKLNEKIGEISEKLNALEQEILKSKPGKAFLLKRKKAELLESEAEVIMQDYGQQCFSQVAGFSEQTRMNSLLPQEVTERTEDMIFNASCLVHTQRIEAMLSMAGQMQKTFRKVGMILDVAGPWPPFSFISIEE